MVVGYVRVSTVEQNEARQLELLNNYGVEKIFVDKCSGKDNNRPALKEMIGFIREGDVIVIVDWSRLGRSVKDLLNLIEVFESKKVSMISLKENFDLSSPQGRLMINLILSINQFEREIINERVREGVALAKCAGKYKGRKIKEVDKELWGEVYGEIKNGTITKTSASKILKISRPKLYRLIEREIIKESERNDDKK